MVRSYVFQVHVWWVLGVEGYFFPHRKWTNSSTERDHVKRKWIIFQPSFFMGYVSLQAGNSHLLHHIIFLGTGKWPNIKSWWRMKVTSKATFNKNTTKNTTNIGNTTILCKRLAIYVRETNSKFAPENGWNINFRGIRPIFRCELLVLRSVSHMYWDLNSLYWG